MSLNLGFSGLNFLEGKKAQKKADEQFEKQIAKQEEAAALWDLLQTPEYKELVPVLADMGILSEDDFAVDAQKQALKELLDYGDDGRSAETDYRMAQIRNEQIQADRAAQDALQQRFARRGVGGSGLEMAAQLQSQQNAANQARMAGLQEAAAAEQRQMMAAQAAGGLAGQTRGQSQQMAQARSGLDRYNAGVQNMAQQYGNQMRAQQYQDQLAKTGGKSSALTGTSNVYGQQAAMSQQEAARRKQQAAQHAQAETDTAMSVLEKVGGGILGG